MKVMLLGVLTLLFLGCGEIYDESFDENPDYTQPETNQNGWRLSSNVTKFTFQLGESQLEKKGYQFLDSGKISVGNFGSGAVYVDLDSALSLHKSCYTQRMENGTPYDAVSWTEDVKVQVFFAPTLDGEMYLNKEFVMNESYSSVFELSSLPGKYMMVKVVPTVSAELDDSSISDEEGTDETAVEKPFCEGLLSISVLGRY